MLDGRFIQFTNPSTFSNYLKFHVIFRYDVSAFNIVLGQMFKFQESEYLGVKEFFRKVDQDPKETGEKNTTSSSTIRDRDRAVFEVEM